MGLLVATVNRLTSASQSTVHKLVLVSNKDNECYMNFHTSHMPQTTQSTSSLDEECVTMTDPNSINVIPNYCLFQFPSVFSDRIITPDKIRCEQFNPIKSVQDTSTMYLKIHSNESMYQIPNGIITDRDYDGTKSNGWFGPKLIELYLSWLLDTSKIDDKSPKSIMMLPFTVFHEFEVIQDNKNDGCPTSIYDDLVKQQQRDIFNTSLSLIFIYRDFCWSLAVLVDFDKANIDPNKKPITDSNQEPRKEKNDKQSNQPKILYFALRTFTKNIDPTIKIVNRHADLFMEKKIKSFINSCWQKRLKRISGNHNHPKSYPEVEAYSMIPSLSSEATGTHTKPMF